MAILGIGAFAGINTITNLKQNNRINSIREDMQNDQSTIESLESQVSALESSCSPGGMSGKKFDGFSRTGKDAIQF